MRFSKTSLTLAIPGLALVGVLLLLVSYQWLTRVRAAQGAASTQIPNPILRRPVDTPNATPKPVFPKAPAAAILVNSLADGAPANNGQCTLREALLNAIGDNQSGSTDCVAGSGPDTITFSVNGTINLTGVLPDISQSLTITGPGANLLTVRRNTGGDYRIFTINSGQTVNFTGLTIANGSLPASEGGGIRNSGNLTVADCAITGNLANGAGGILNSSSLTMTGSTLSGNTANFDGGGLYNLGNATATLINCTISGNTGGASFNSGVVTAAGAGETATTTLNNCTVTANTGNNAIGSFNLGGATVTTQLRNTLVAANSGNNFNIGASTTLTSLGNNLDSDGTSGFTNGVGGNLVGTAGTPLNAQLGALANNGGKTQTHALNAGSPAINAGTNTGAPATDQRGISRPQGAAVDIGAFEATANPLLVTNTNDAGAGSLRQAIATANGNGAGLDDIIFDNTVFNTAKTITLASGELTISDNLTINGPGANLLTVSGANLSRIFNISAGAASVSIAGMTMRDGRPVGGAGGGAILINNGAASGPVNISDCLITNNDVTAASNPLGGGIDNEGGTVTITRSTISNNVASFRGGGLQNQGVGSTMTIVNSTISGNTAGTTGIGGAIRSLVPLTLTSCTVFGNSAQTGGNISRSNGTLSFGNTIIAGGTLLGAGGTSPDVDGTLTSLDYNLIQNTTGATISGTTTRDITGVSPQLGPLTNNGGPTPTHALLAGSPALDKGNSSGSITDQRGLTRPFDITTIPSATGGDNADIGAFETQALIVTNANDSGAGSLRQVLTDANANADLNDILFDATFFNTARTINLASALPALTTSLNINGPGANLLTVRRDTGGDYRIFNILSGKVVTISGLTISNGKTTSGQGGGILNNGTLSLTNCILSGNQASASVAQGGGIYSATGTLNVSHCTLSGNTSSSNNNISGNNLGGGGIFVGNGVVNITGSTFSGNTSTNVGGSGSHGGGGLYLEAGTLNISNSTLSGNTVSNGAGGGLSTRGPGSANLVNTTITNNFAGRGGGFFNNSAATAKNTIIAQNTNNVITDTPDIRGPFTSLGNNLIGIDNFGAFVNGVNNDQVGSAAAPLDAKLAPLGNYGGPTATHALLLGSPALDKGHSSGSTTDQRGSPRPVDLPGFPAAANGDSADIGAFEAQTLPLPAIVINDVAVAEGNAGTSTATFTVTLSAASAQTVTVQYATANGTATAGSDYVTTNGTLTFNPGVTSQPVNVTINGDTVLEQGETFFVNLSNPANAVVTDPQGLGLILNDEPYIVTNANDAGAGSLRQALLDANASPGAETILFEPVFFGATRTINLAGALPDITESLTINGPGPNLLTVRRDAGGDYRIFTILSGQTVVLAGMTITGGNDSSGGGGIQSSGDLTVTNCQISGNQSSVAGGGIFNNGGTLTVTHSTIANNTCNGSFTSGGIDSSSTGSVTLLNTTISGNSVTGADGSNGGGLWTTSPTTITNCTITNNSAAGASSAGGVRRHDGTMTTRNSIIAANQNNSTMPDVIAANDTGITSSGFNLIGNVGTLGGIFNQPGDQTSTGAAPINPLLAGLGNYCGATQTHLLLPGSPAINAGTSTGAPITDQRGVARPQGAAVDIGAVELASLVVTNTNDAGAGSLRQAIMDANASAGVNDISFNLPAGPQTINLAGVLPDITDSVTIVNTTGANNLTVRRDTGGDYRIFNIPGSGLNVAISGLTISNGKPASGSSGGGIRSFSNLTLTNCAIVNNETVGIALGGGVDLLSADGLFTGCTFSGNTAASQGGAINYQGNGGHTLQLTNCTISGNTANGGGFGGGIANISSSGSSTLAVVNSTIASNTSATANGGGIRTVVSGAGTSATTTLRNTIIANNSAPNLLTLVAGGGGAATITSLGNNLASDNGGGFLTGPGDLINTNPLLVSLGNYGGSTQTHLLQLGSPALNAGSNTGAPATDQRGIARPQGAAVDIGAVEMAPLFVTNTNDTGAGSLRQAIMDANASAGVNDISFNLPAGPQTINLAGVLPDITDSVDVINATGANNLTVRRNTGGDYRIFTINSGAVSLTGLTITNGKASEGGGIQNFGALTVTNCALIGNNATNRGGALENNGTLTLTNSTLSGNTTTNDGGGLVNTSNATLTNCTLSDNTSINSFASGIATLASPAATTTLTNCTVTANVGADAIRTFGFSGATAAVTQLKNTLVAANTGANFNTFGTNPSLTSLGNNLDSDGTSGFVNGMNSDLVGTAGSPLNALLAPLANNGGPTATHALLLGSPALDKGHSSGSATDQRGLTRPVDLPGLPAATPGDSADIGAFEAQTLPPPAIVINDVAVAEGNAGTSTATFTVTLSAASAQTVTVQFATANDTATAGSDYVATGGTLTFNPGVTSQPANVTINGDTVFEQGETFFVNLSNPANAVLGDPQGLGLILNDEPYIVTNANDAGAGSLRQAITDANASAGVNDISFNLPAGPQTINLASALPDITDSVNLLNGTGANNLTVRRDTGGDYRIFHIPGGGLTIAISGLTISNGKTASGGFGGGIRSLSNLTLTNCAIVNNEAVGNVAGGAGGGVQLLSADGLFTGCTFSGNTAGNQGGAINYQGNGGHTLQLTNCTVSGNTANGSGLGGGIANISSSGSSTLAVVNSTIASNTSATDNGGGIVTFTSGAGTTVPTTLRNTIIANNTAPNLRTATQSGGSPGTITSLGNNLASDGGNGFLNGPGDLINTNPLLVSLGNYGGPTQTHALLLGSPAINAGNNTGAPATDQRGIARPQQSTVDIGAFESRGFTLAILGGNNQTAPVNTAFANPLTVSVTANAAGEPVGGLLTFTPPSNGPSATLANNPAPVAIGFAGSGMVTANGIGGSYNVAANANGAVVAVNFALTNTGANTPPTFTPAAAITRQQGSLAGAAVAVGMAADGQSAAGSLIVTQIAGGSATGITVTNIVNTNGAITAQVATSCTATAGTVRFQVSDGSLTGTGDLQVNLSANTPPTLSYANANVAGGGATTINPATGPADNGTINTIVVQSQGTFAGAVTVDNATGVVSASNAAPVGIHTINIRATDACGAQTNASFTLTVGCLTGLTVNNLGDGADAAPGNGVCETAAGNGICTLRAAIQEANLLTSCSPLTINFNVTGTIALGTALPTLVHPNLTLQGPGANLLTISGNNAVRVLNIGSGNLNVTLDSLRLANGQVNAQAGAGIQNASAGTLTLLNCTIANNSITGVGSGAGIANNAGTLVITNSTLTNNAVSNGVGGGIFNPSGTVTITNSTLADNGGINGGGGLWSNATANPVTLTGVTITGNTAGNGSGGGVRNSGSGTLTLTNCTLANNSANFNGGGAANVGTGTLMLLNSTLSNNISVSSGGGGLWTSPTGMVNLKNTLVAGNSATTGPDVSGALTSQGHNLVGNGDGGTGLINGINNDQAGTTAAPLNALLAALSNYGGPTLTLALLPGSPAINAGTNTGAPATDQRGIARPQQTTTDIGAFESRGFTLAIVSGSGQSAITNAAFANPLVVGVSSANAEPLQGGRVTFTAPGNGASATLTGTPATIAANGQAGITATANGVGGSYNVAANANGGASPASFNLTNTACPAITVNPNNPTLPNGRAGTAYSQTFTQTGGAGTVNFTVSAGALPTGLTLTGDVLAGTPTVNGTFNFTVRATDQNNCMGERAYTLLLHPPCTTITVNPATLPNGTVGTAYNQTLTASGGTAPYTFAVTSGSLPGGLNLASGGALTGTPTASGSFNFTVTATDNTGCTGTRAYNVIVSGNGLQFYPLPAPVRLLDTRAGEAACTQPSAPIAGQTSLTQMGRGLCNIPANAVALTGNLTTVQSGGGYLTLYPSNASQPTVASTNYNPNEIINNVFTVGLGTDGAFKIFAFNTTEVVVDVTGYYAPPSTGGLYFHPLPKPIRLLETRAGELGCNTPGAPIQGGAAGTRTQQARLTCDGVTIPNGALAIVGNATTVGPQAGGYLTLFPANAAQPLVASSNYNAGQVVNGPFSVGLAPNGEFNIFSFATTDLVVDVLGYYSSEANDVNGAGLLFNPLPKPVRLLETRANQAVGCYLPGLPLISGVENTQPARGACDGVTIPANALGVVGNATVVTPNAAGFLTLWPSTALRPLVATANYNAGDIGNRHFIVGLGAGDGAFKLFSSATSHLVVDLSGYFAP
jgi:CSLREA domain-containing protein